MYLFGRRGFMLLEIAIMITITLGILVSIISTSNYLSAVSAVKGLGKSVLERSYIDLEGKTTDSVGSVFTASSFRLQMKKVLSSFCDIKGSGTDNFLFWVSKVFRDSSYFVITEEGDFSLRMDSEIVMRQWIKRHKESLKYFGEEGVLVSGIIITFPGSGKCFSFGNLLSLKDIEYRSVTPRRQRAESSYEKVAGL